MADPISLGLLAWGAVAVTTGAVLGGVSAAQQHEQARANAEMQAQQAEYNKRLAEREAARTEAETAENMRRQHEAAEELKARQRAMLGHSGAAFASGSPLAVLGQTAADEELKVLDTAYAGYSSAQQHREQAKMYQYQAGVARAQKPSSSSLGLNIAGQAVGAVGQIAQLGASAYSTSQATAKSGNRIEYGKYWD